MVQIFCVFFTVSNGVFISSSFHSCFVVSSSLIPDIFCGFFEFLVVFSWITYKGHAYYRKECNIRDFLVRGEEWLTLTWISNFLAQLPDSLSICLSLFHNMGHPSKSSNSFKASYWSDVGTKTDVLTKRCGAAESLQAVPKALDLFEPFEVTAPPLGGSKPQSESCWWWDPGHCATVATYTFSKLRFAGSCTGSFLSVFFRGWWLVNAQVPTKSTTKHTKPGTFCNSPAEPHSAWAARYLPPLWRPKRLLPPACQNLKGQKDRSGSVEA